MEAAGLLRLGDRRAATPPGGRTPGHAGPAGQGQRGRRRRDHHPALAQVRRCAGRGQGGRPGPAAAPARRAGRRGASPRPGGRAHQRGGRPGQGLCAPAGRGAQCADRRVRRRAQAPERRRQPLPRRPAQCAAGPRGPRPPRRPQGRCQPQGHPGRAAGRGARPGRPRQPRDHRRLRAPGRGHRRRPPAGQRRPVEGQRRAAQVGPGPQPLALLPDEPARRQCQEAGQEGRGAALVRGGLQQERRPGDAAAVGRQLSGRVDRAGAGGHCPHRENGGPALRRGREGSRRLLRAQRTLAEEGGQPAGRLGQDPRPDRRRGPHPGPARRRLRQAGWRRCQGQGGVPGVDEEGVRNVDRGRSVD
mmetsp:Transcript_77831/g.215767  ORF Transcript_77831/g.215767 Transcript_77831/m.215767 type:complete len:360 (-) Transcript_77831:1538-2617(-)